MTVAYWSCKVFWYQTPSLRALECSRCESRRIADASPFALTIERPISVEDSDARTRVDILHPSKINAIGRMVTVLVVDGASMESRLRLGKRHCASFPHYCCC